MSSHSVAAQQQQRAPLSFTPLHTNLLQRKCACGGTPGVDGECAECRKKRLSMQRRAANLTAPTGPSTTVPSIVHEVLGSPGQSLDARTRTYMEPRFGHDFSHVRVHTDARAAESARAVNALAYTVGRDVVFGAEQYAPQKSLGKRLLAHELTHVVQQSRGSISSSGAVSEDLAEREAEHNAHIAETNERLTFAALPPVPAYARGEATVGVGITPSTSTGPKACTSDQGIKTIAPALKEALKLLWETTSRLKAYISAGSAKDMKAEATKTILNALNHHFRATDNGTAQHVLDRLTAIKDFIEDQEPLTIQCPKKEEDETCSTNTAAYVTDKDSTIIFCPHFFEMQEEQRAVTIIHETAHILVGGDKIRDRGYIHERVYPLLSTAESLTNAESYGHFVLELGAGQVQKLRTDIDPQLGCREPSGRDWSGPITNAVARAHVWNRVAVLKNKGRSLDQPANKFLQDAQKVYEKVDAALSNPVEFKCDLKGGGKCATNVYWYRGFLDSNLHICPPWINTSKEDDRVQSLLEGLFDLFGEVHDRRLQRGYARNAKFYALGYLPKPKETSEESSK